MDERRTYQTKYTITFGVEGEEVSTEIISDSPPLWTDDDSRIAGLDEIKALEAAGMAFLALLHTGDNVDYTVIQIDGVIKTQRLDYFNGCEYGRETDKRNS